MNKNKKWNNHFVVISILRQNMWPKEGVKINLEIAVKGHCCDFSKGNQP